MGDVMIQTQREKVDPPALAPRRSARWTSILALLLIVPAPSLACWAAMIAWPDMPLGKGIYIAAKAWMFLLPVAWLFWVDRQRLSLSPARRGGFGLAILLGLAISAIIFIAYALLGSKLIDPTTVRTAAVDNGVGTIAGFLGGAAYWILINSVLEEYVYRWFVFRKFEVLFGSAAAVLLSAVAFTLHHIVALKVQFNWSVTAISCTGIFLGGAIFSWLYMRYRSVWVPYVAHAIVDVAVYIIGWRLIFG